MSFEVQRWPTPVVTDAVGAGNRNLEGSKAHAGNSLTDVVRGGQAPRWPTPASSTGDGGPHGLDGGAGSRSMLPDGLKRSSGSLNPDWVEMLMGWPAGWTSLDPLDCLDWPAAHGAWPAPPGPQHDWEPPRVAVGVKDRVKRLKALGNGQVPQTAAMAWEVLS